MLAVGLGAVPVTCREGLCVAGPHGEATRWQCAKHRKFFLPILSHVVPFLQIWSGFWAQT